jgi:hypothetical protein
MSGLPPDPAPLPRNLDEYIESIVRGCGRAHRWLVGDGPLLRAPSGTGSAGFAGRPGVELVSSIPSSAIEHVTIVLVLCGLSNVSDVDFGACPFGARR